MFSFDLSLYIFISLSLSLSLSVALKVKVGVREFLMHKAESKWFSEHRPENVSVHCSTHIQNYAVGFFYKIWNFISAVKNVCLISIYVPLF